MVCGGEGVGPGTGLAGERASHADERPLEGSRQRTGGRVVLWHRGTQMRRLLPRGEVAKTSGFAASLGAAGAGVLGGRFHRETTHSSATSTTLGISAGVAAAATSATATTAITPGGLEGLFELRNVAAERKGYTPP